MNLDTSYTFRISNSKSIIGLNAKHKTIKLLKENLENLGFGAVFIVQHQKCDPGKRELVS